MASWHRAKARDHIDRELQLQCTRPTAVQHNHLQLRPDDSIEPDDAIRRYQTPRKPTVAAGGAMLPQSPDGGIPLWSSPAHRTTAKEASCVNQGTPTRTANMRVRRDHGPVLLQSPARAGHATRMKSIFAESRLESPRHQPDGGIILYPTLPNTCRVVSPAPRESWFQSNSSFGVGARRPGSELPHSAAPGVDALSSKRSSGSWSNDSGYLITEPHVPTSPPASPRKRIDAWLRTFPDEKERDEDASQCNLIDESDQTLHTEAGVWKLGEGTPKLQQDPFIHRKCYSGKSSDEASQELSRIPRASPRLRPQRYVSDVCKVLRFDQATPPTDAETDKEAPPPPPLTPRTSTQCNNLSHSCPQKSNGAEDGGIEIVPLSPNVCVERGPSRYHSAHKDRNVKHDKEHLSLSPSPVQRINERSKENTRAGVGVSPGGKSVFAWRKNERARRRRVVVGDDALAS